MRTATTTPSPRRANHSPCRVDTRGNLSCQRLGIPLYGEWPLLHHLANEPPILLCRLFASRRCRPSVLGRLFEIDAHPYTGAVRKLNPSALEFVLNLLEARALRLYLTRLESKDGGAINRRCRSQFILCEAKQISSCHDLSTGNFHFLLDFA